MNVFYWVAVTLVTIVASGRLTRLAIVDKFPPVAAVRHWYQNKTDGSEWIWLSLCGYCFSFWATVIVVVWGYFAGPLTVSGNHDTSLSALIWWYLFGTLAASYLAVIVMANDGDNGDDD